MASRFATSRRSPSRVCTLKLGRSAGAAQAVGMIGESVHFDDHALSVPHTAQLDLGLLRSANVTIAIEQGCPSDPGALTPIRSRSRRCSRWAAWPIMSQMPPPSHPEPRNSQSYMLISFSHSASRSLPNRVKDEGCSMKIAGVRVCFGSSSESEGYPSRSRSSARVSLSSGRSVRMDRSPTTIRHGARPGRRMAGRLHSAQSEPAWSAPTQPAAPASPSEGVGLKEEDRRGSARASRFLGRLVADVLSHDHPLRARLLRDSTDTARLGTRTPSLKRAEVPGIDPYAPSSAKSITSSGPSIRAPALPRSGIAVVVGTAEWPE